MKPKITSDRCEVKIRRHDRKVVVVQQVTYTGDFYESFELESYPFDVQPLMVEMRKCEEQQAALSAARTKRTPSTHALTPC